MSQTSKQVIDNVINRVAPDRLPSSFSAQSIVIRQKGYTLEEFWNLPPDEQAQINYDLTKDYGGDYLHAGFNGTLVVGALGGNVKFREHGSPDVEEPLINSISELDKIDISKIKDYFYYKQSIDAAKRTVELANGEYNIIVGSWGIFTQAGLIYGAEPLMRAALRDKPAVYALLDFTFELFKAMHEEVIDIGATVGSSGDPTSSGDMISKRTFEEFSLPYLQKTFDWFKSKGLKATLHICGDINDRIDLIPDTHTDILSVDYKVDINRAAKILDGRVVIGGNVDPASVILMEDAETVRKAYEKIIADLDGIPYIVMPGCGIPQHTPLENIVAVNELARSTVPSPYTVGR
ncbi:MAG: uroporphyrinogen decarboxylase family protein [Oscillospiraceae bacterium]|jgi:uroporphyrinogen decarboxylase|nr:uroporphyrinogen decarboxylase family protein [Oscillospiraceae bacterium]